MIFCTAFDGPGVLPDKAYPTDPQIPSSLNPAQGDWDDDGGSGGGGGGVGVGNDDEEVCSLLKEEFKFKISVC